jgi:hypothetical protein
MGWWRRTITRPERSVTMARSSVIPVAWSRALGGVRAWRERERGRGTYKRACLGEKLGFARGLGSNGDGVCRVQAKLARMITSSDKRARFVNGSARLGGVPLRLGG